MPDTDVSRLKRAYVNEKCAPEILPFEGDLMRRVTESVDAQESTVAASRAAAGEGGASSATDDLTGWTERVDGERKHYDGMLEKYKITAEDAEDLIMRARLQAGWVTQEDLDAMKAAEEAAEDEEAATDVSA